MKKKILIGIPAVLALALVFFGPELVDLVRLQAYLTESQEAYQANKGEWPHLTDACETCHGRKGNSLHQGYPSLAGQPESYLAIQLRQFASGERENPNMSPLAMTMSKEEIQRYAEFFSRQTAKENQFFDADPELQEQGERLVESGGCAGCHGTSLTGQGEFPLLAGQGYDYLVKQLDAFASGERKDATGVMNSMVGSLSADERKAIASYLAGLPPITN